MVRFVAVGLTTVFLLFVSQLTASAHLFGGPPFLSVNGQDAETNAIYQSSVSSGAFSLPQDMAPGTYAVDSPIHFKVDINKLPVTPEIAQQSTFRWTWTEGDADKQTDTELSHTYTKPGSHLVSLEVLPPGDQEYILYDTVRVEVLADPNYHLPTVQAGVVEDDFSAKKPLKFISQITTDPTATIKSITWDFGDESSSEEANPIHAYQDNDYLRFAYVQIEDSNGFKVEHGLTLSANSGELEITPLNPSETEVLMVDPSQSPHTTSLGWTSWWPYITLLLVALIGTGIAWYINKNKQPKNVPQSKP